MKTLCILLAIFLFSVCGMAQDMNPKKLKAIVAEVADTLQNSGNAFRFRYEGTLMICVYDEAANRMRIMTPIIERAEIGEEEFLNAMVANYHTALDVRYALSDEIIWSVYLHPLRSLGNAQLIDAISQVHKAAATFGSTYSSSDLVFPGNSRKKGKGKPAKELLKG
jgi:hypothetical protein